MEDEVVIASSSTEAGIGCWNLRSGVEHLWYPSCASPSHGLVFVAGQFFASPQLRDSSSSSGSVLCWSWNKTLAIVTEHQDKFKVVALAAGSNVTLLANQIKAFKPQLVSIKNESLVSELKKALAGSGYMPEIIPGDEGVIEVARHPDCVTVVTGTVGCAGLKG